MVTTLIQMEEIPNNQTMFSFKVWTLQSSRAGVQKVSEENEEGEPQLDCG